MTDNEQRAIGQIEGELKGICREMKLIHAKLDDIISGESATGKKNADEIKCLGIRLGKVERTIGKAVLIGYLVLGSGKGAELVAEAMFK